MSDSLGNSTPTRRPTVLRLLVALASVLMVVAIVSTLPNAAPPAGKGEANTGMQEGIKPSGKPLSLTLDGPPGTPRQTLIVDYSVAATPLSLLRESHISVQSSGSGSSAFITSIAGIENEGAGGKNWIFSVNDAPGTTSADAVPLPPGARVLWKFAPYE